MRRLKPRSALPLRARNQPVAQRPEHVQRPVPDHAESGPTAPARQPVRRKAHLPDPGKPVLTLPVPAHALEGLRWAQRPDGPARTPHDVLCFPAPGFGQPREPAPTPLVSPAPRESGPALRGLQRRPTLRAFLTPPLPDLPPADEQSRGLVVPLCTARLSAARSKTPLLRSQNRLACSSPGCLPVIGPKYAPLFAHLLNDRLSHEPRSQGPSLGRRVRRHGRPRSSPGLRPRAGRAPAHPDAQKPQPAAAPHHPAGSPQDLLSKADPLGTEGFEPAIERLPQKGQVSPAKECPEGLQGRYAGAVQGTLPGKLIRGGPGPQPHAPQGALAAQGGENQDGTEGRARLPAAKAPPGVGDGGQDIQHAATGSNRVHDTTSLTPSAQKYLNLRKRESPGLDSVVGNLPSPHCLGYGPKRTLVPWSSLENSSPWGRWARSP